MSTKPRILTYYVDPPIPNGAHWTAQDDRLGADTSPIGQGATEQEAIDDLLAKLECMT
jgi:hypothetical protein